MIYSWKQEKLNELAHDDLHEVCMMLLFIVQRMTCREGKYLGMRGSTGEGVGGKGLIKSE